MPKVVPLYPDRIPDTDEPEHGDGDGGGGTDITISITGLAEEIDETAREMEKSRSALSRLFWFLMGWLIGGLLW